MFGGGAPVEVEVKFDSYQGRYARERPFHPTQLSKPISDGRLRVTFETTEAALEQMARWLMQYGEHARASVASCGVARDGVGEVTKGN